MGLGRRDRISIGEWTFILEFLRFRSNMKKGLHWGVYKGFLTTDAIEAIALSNYQFPKRVPKKGMKVWTWYNTSVQTWPWKYIMKNSWSFCNVMENRYLFRDTASRKYHNYCNILNDYTWIFNWQYVWMSLPGLLLQTVGNGVLFFLQFCFW